MATRPLIARAILNIHPRSMPEKATPKQGD